MMELINAPGWARNVYPVTYLSGSTQDCADLHSFGPGMREIYILHYVLRGRGVFEENGRVFPVETGPGPSFATPPTPPIPGNISGWTSAAARPPPS